MKILLLCGSPRPKGSNSLYLLQALQARLGEGHAITLVQAADWNPGAREAVLQAVWDSDRIVLAFPLYVDGIPSNLLGVLRAVEEQAPGRRAAGLVYAVVNNGFYEAEQNITAIEMVWNWCRRCGLPQGRALAVGAGEMAQAAPLGRGPGVNLGRAMDAFAQDVKQGNIGGTRLVEPNFPRFLYKQAAHMGWRRKAKGNGLPVRAIRRAPGGKGE